MNENELYSHEEKRLMLSLARSAMESVLKREKIPNSSKAPEKFHETASCFVTLHTIPDRNLRGCIGNIGGFEPLALNIVHNAVNSAFRDPRFQPVSSLEELSSLEIEISVLTPPEDISSLDEFIIGKHGIILLKNGRSAVFLPQVAPEQGWDKETTLTHLSMKAGLPSGAWQDKDAAFKVFSAIVFSETSEQVDVQ